MNTVDRLLVTIGMQLLSDLNAAVDLLLCQHAASVHARTVCNAGTVLKHYVTQMQQ
jgi:hypothetical protein